MTARDPDPLGDKLVEAAAEVFAEYGYDGARVAEIARRAGVTTGAIYSRYRGKAELLVDALGEPVTDQIERVAADAPDGTLGLLASLADDVLVDHPGDWLLLEAVVAGRRDAGIAEVIRHRFADGEVNLAKVIQQAQDAGLVDPALPTAGLAQLAMTIGLGSQLRRLAGSATPDLDDWHTVIGMIIDAAAPPAHPTTESRDTP